LPKMTSFRALLVVALAVTVLAACQGETPEPRPSPSPTIESPTPTSSPTASPIPTVAAGAPSPEVAARTLYDGWQAGDRTKASQFATQAAVDVVFARPAFALDFAGCDAEASGFACSFETDTEELKMTLSGNATSGFRVESAAFITA
jgi:hypothetical protein